MDLLTRTPCNHFMLKRAGEGNRAAKFEFPLCLFLVPGKVKGGRVEEQWRLSGFCLFVHLQYGLILGIVLCLLSDLSLGQIELANVSTYDDTQVTSTPLPTIKVLQQQGL